MNMASNRTNTTHLIRGFPHLIGCGIVDKLAVLERHSDTPPPHWLVQHCQPVVAKGDIVGGERSLYVKSRGVALVGGLSHPRSPPPTHARTLGTSPVIKVPSQGSNRCARQCTGFPSPSRTNWTFSLFLAMLAVACKQQRNRELDELLALLLRAPHTRTSS